ncbi:MAG: hypothetical protein AAGM33_12160, partial [Pseudomonadota bacterium]
MPALSQTLLRAGSIIGNQASVQFLDGEGILRTSNSNIVRTTIQQVGNVELVPDLQRDTSPGGQVVFPHVLTNRGNDADRFDLIISEDPGSDFQYTSTAIYIDSNRDGFPDNTSPLSQTPLLQREESFSFVVIAVSIYNGRRNVRN